MVPMLRSRGVETSAAACRTTAAVPFCAMALSVSPAPSTVFSDRCRSGTAMRDMTVFGSWWRRFMFGYKSVPPATNMPSGPASAFMRSASASVFGCRYVKDGSLSISAAAPGRPR